MGNELYPEMATAASIIRGRKYSRRRPRAGKYHVHEGFPHYSSTRKNGGLCMCLQECCHGDSGCICLSCPCRGKGHN